MSKNKTNKPQTLANVLRVRGVKQFQQKSEALKAEGFLPLPRTLASVGKETRRDYFETAIQMLNVGSDIGGDAACKPVPLIFAQTGNERQDKNGKNIGTEGLGWMEWGATNRLPNVVSLLTGMLPYTAVAHKFNTDLLSGMGPQPMYRYTQYVGGNVSTKEIPYHDAGKLLEGQITELLQQISKLEEEHPELKSDGTLASIRDAALGKTNAVGKRVDNRSAVEVLHDQMNARLKALNADFEEWKKTDKEVRGFITNNSLALTFLQLAADFQLLGICFAELQLSIENADKDGEEVKGSMWKPKVTGISFRPSHICRLERMDKDWRSNYVYLSNQWMTDPYMDLSANIEKSGDPFDIDALPAIRVDKAVSDLNNLVIDARLSEADKSHRPTRVIMPIHYPTPGCPYYPKPAWQSIFAGDIYEYAATLISDRLRRKRNSNVIGRIIYLHQAYLDSVWRQNNCNTDDERAKMMEKLFNEINNYLSNRDNSGSSLLAYTFIGGDGKEHESFKVVEIESTNNKTTDANQKELQEISSIICFSWLLDSRLVGNTPGTESSSGGTDLRERYMVKQIQMAPSANLFLTPLRTASAINQWDEEHLVWRIKREVMTTLDNSKTGITEAKSE